MRLWMEDLPQHLVVEILSRLADSADLARCRIVSKSLNSLARQVRSINLFCTPSHYIKSRSPDSYPRLKPFKTVFLDLVRDSRVLESVSIGVDRSLRELSDDDVDDESDDLHLSEAGFVNQWLPRVCGELRRLSISDFWFQSCWRKSEVLGLISSCCNCLQELELKNAWLKVDGLSLMPSLTSLTLEFIRLDDEDLNTVNTCFPSLQVLNLIGVGGLNEPKINLPQLECCHWTVSNAPLSLSIIAPNLVKLRLKCVRPTLLVLDTPLLSDFHLSIDKVNEFIAKDFGHLRNLKLESSSLHSLLSIFPSGKAINRLSVDSKRSGELLENQTFHLEPLLDAFPNIKSLTLGPGAWSEAEAFFCAEGLEGRTEIKGLKEIIAHLTVDKIHITRLFIHSVLDRCTNLLDMALLIPSEGDCSAASSLISMCRTDHPSIRWKWGFGRMRKVPGFQMAFDFASLPSKQGID